jgi:hypothetical protein
METIEIKGAKSFFNAISLDNEKLNGFLKKSIFRGHSDANWLAIPSAFRPNKLLLSENTLRPLGKRTNREQIEAEFYTLLLFIDELNQNGFHIPNEDILNIDTNRELFVDFLNKIGRGELVWPPKNYHSIISIAQHNGIPTRFLDFTYDPYVALYFAAKGVLDGCESEYISIYAINIYQTEVRGYDFIENFDRDGLYHKRPENRLYQMIKSPSSYNHNLRNQKGLFLSFVEKSFYSNDKFAPYSIEEYMIDSKSRNGGYKFVTKARNAPEIMRLLHNRFYSASTIFPSIEGCAKSIYEKNKII